MKDRLFPIVHAPGGPPAQRIECGACGAHAEVVTNGPHLPPAASANIFRKRGWAVASTPRKDRCPACIDAARFARAAAAGASAEPPRQMAREDRRIILAKLEEIYLNERDGYAKGWNDERIAKELDYPRAWVAQMRDENFGPQKSEQSAEVQAITEAIAAGERILADIRPRLDGLEGDQRATVAELKRLGEAAAAAARLIEKARAEVQKLTGRS